MPPETDSPQLSSTRRRLRLVVLLLSLLAGPLLAEGTLRCLLFHPSELARSWGAGLRDASLFADRRLEDEYWRLRWKLAEVRPRGQPSFDPLLGWTGPRVEPGTYIHHSPPPADRRPILWYGASYASCVKLTMNACFEDLFPSTESGETYALVNYGVGGYGFDQAYLMFRETLDHYAGRDPVIVFALVSDTDLERSALAFRTWPKPLLRTDGSLQPVAPVEPGSAAYLERHGVGISSYAWRYLLHGTDALPAALSRRWRRTAEKQRAQARLLSQILTDIRDRAEARGLELFFVLCCSPGDLERFPDEGTPREHALTSVLHELNVPFVLARDRFVEALQDRPSDAPALFLDRDPGRNHPTLEGNLLLLECLRDGLGGRFD